MKKEEIYEKMMKVSAETARGLDERPADQKMVTYVKNKSERIIEFVKNIEFEWIMRERVVKQDPKGPTEVVEFIDLNQRNEDILPVEAFVDQGTSTHKDPRFPSDRMFRECVVGRDGKLLAFFSRNKEPIAFWKRTEWLKEKFECSTKDAIRYREVFKRMQYDKNMIFKIIEEEIKIDYLESLADQLPEIPYNIVPEEIEPQEYSEYSLAAAFPGESIKLKQFIKRYKEEEKEPEGIAFGLHPLHYEEDGCSHEFLTFLRFASIKEIKGIMKGFFKTKNEWGYPQRERFWYLTSSQKSQAWRYINDRRMELGIYEKSIRFSK